MNQKIEDRVGALLAQIGEAAQRAGRKSEDISLVAVSKTRTVEEMNATADALRAAGRQVIFGESYVQEYEEKKARLRGDFFCHLIGPLQSNKVARAVSAFDFVESVHSEKILRLIDAEAKKTIRSVPIFVQVNISHDPNKSGFLPGDIDRLFTEVLPECHFLTVHGLMTITEQYERAEDARADFAALRALSEKISGLYSGVPMVQEGLELSMGMSQDFQVAIEEGATVVRVGTALFGQR